MFLRYLISLNRFHYISEPIDYNSCINKKKYKQQNNIVSLHDNNLLPKLCNY